MHRGADNTTAPTGNTQSRLTHQLTQGQPPFIHQGQPQLIHIAEVAVEGGWRQPRFARHLSEAKTGEAPLGGQLIEGRVDNGATGFLFLFGTDTHW